MLTRVSVLFGIWVLSLTPHAHAQEAPWGNNTNWVWTAPEPPLPGTRWYDYGWDSTSNGPTPAVIEGEVELAARVQGKTHATGRWMAKARALPRPPIPQPPLPPRAFTLHAARFTPQPAPRPIIIVFRLF